MERTKRLCVLWLGFAFTANDATAQIDRRIDSSRPAGLSQARRIEPLVGPVRSPLLRESVPSRLYPRQISGSGILDRSFTNTFSIGQPPPTARLDYRLSFPGFGTTTGSSQRLPSAGIEWGGFAGPVNASVGESAISAQRFDLGMVERRLTSDDAGGRDRIPLRAPDDSRLRSDAPRDVADYLEDLYSGAAVLSVPSKTENTLNWNDSGPSSASVAATNRPSDVSLSVWSDMELGGRVVPSGIGRPGDRSALAGRNSTGRVAVVLGPSSGPVAATVPGGGNGTSMMKTLVWCLPAAIGLAWIGRIVILRRTVGRVRRQPVNGAELRTAPPVSIDSVGPANPVVAQTMRHDPMQNRRRPLQPQVSMHTTCKRCRYDLFGCRVGGRCPECGESILRGLRRPAPRRWFGRWRRRRTPPEQASNVGRPAVNPVP